MSRSFSIIALLLGLATAACAQFDLQDSLRGSITPERAWWDLTYYHLDIAVDPAQRSIAGSNTIAYRVLEPAQRMQIDLQPPMRLTAAEQDGQALTWEQLGNVYYLQLQKEQIPGLVNQVKVSYSGKPKVARRPPWDGGLTWATDENGKPFVATACQGDGASLWWPCKDHAYDEPDSMLISVRVPDTLTEVSNGRLRGITPHEDGTHTFHWFVGNPINNYGVNVNIGDYVHWSEVYQGEAGPLDCDYYVLSYNLDKAKEQFKQVPMMLDAFEHWFGPYPFYKDGFKLVEVPYLGMEHQSSVTYGNGYQNGYLGRDMSGSGWGLKFDFIIIHEAGHEWFANSITYKDIADMWIHEGFTAYSENLYVDYHFGKEASADYVIGTRLNIMNDYPVIGPYDVNQAGSTDMYYKGANMLHTIRALLDDDDQWRQVLRGINETFYHQTVTTQQIEAYLIEHTGLGLTAVFDQYLRDVRVPVLEYAWRKNKLSYRWAEAVPHFDMPVLVHIGGTPHKLKPTTEWQQKRLPKPGKLEVDRNYYVGERRK